MQGIHLAGVRRTHFVADGRKAIGEAVEHQIILDAHVEVSAHVQQVQRTVPLIGGQEVQQEQLRLGNVVLVLGHGEHDLLRNLVGKFFRDNPVFEAVLLVHRNHNIAGADEIQLAAAFQRDLHFRVLEHVHHVRQQHGRAVVVGNIHKLVGAVQVLLLRDREFERFALVAGPFHLVDVPVRPQQRGIHHTHVRAHALNLLGIPQREGIVVSVGDQEAVLPYRVQVVPGHLRGRIPVGAVVVVPVLGRHECRYAQAQGRYSGGKCPGSLLPCSSAQPLIQRRHAQADPDGKHIERPGIGIVTLAHLVRRLVQIQDNSDARHEEHQEHNPAATLVFVVLEHQAQQTQQQRQEEVMVLALVLRQRRGSIRLVSQAEFVQKADAALPVAVKNIARQRGMDVVLAAHKVPHEIAPVHPIELIVKEISHIGPKAGLAVLGALYARALPLRIGLVKVDIPGIGPGPHARKQHLAFRQVSGVCGGLRLHVFPVERRPVLVLLEVVRGVEILPVHQRRGTVLLTAQVTHQRVRIVRLILVGGRFDAGADNHHGEEREAHHQGGDAQDDRVPEHPALFEGDKQRPEAQHQQPHQEKQRAGIVRKAKTVHKNAVEEGRQLGQVRDKEVHQQEFNHHANRKDTHQLLERQLFTLVHAIVVHEHEGWNGKEVKQVHADTQAHQEGDEHHPAAGMGLVGVVVPLAHGPEHQRREEGTHGIYLALHRTEPEGVAEAVCQRANGSGAEDGHRPAQGDLSARFARSR